MSDPVAEAAHRALIGSEGYSAPPWLAEAAAREALWPIRKLVEKWEAFGDEPDVNDLKKLIYASGEPGRA